MADKKITALTDLSAAGKAGEDFLHIIDYGGGSSPVNKKISLTNLFSTIPVATSVIGASTTLDVSYGAGTNSALKVSNNASATGVGTVVINDGATPYVDFTVKTDNSATGIFVDSSADTVTINGDHANLDFIVNGDTASFKTIHSDASYDAVGIGNATLDGTASLQVGADATTGHALKLHGNLLISETVAHSAAGAVPITKPVVLLTVDGTKAFTLADGVAGQIITIIVVAATNTPNGTLTPASRNGYASIDLDAAGETVTFMFHDSKWNIIGIKADNMIN